MLDHSRAQPLVRFSLTMHLGVQKPDKEDVSMLRLRPSKLRILSRVS
jgi:hypothetical protein